MDKMTGSLQSVKNLQDATISLVVKRAVEGSLKPEVHTLAERIIQDPNLPGKTGNEKLFYVAQRVLKYHADPITGEMIVAPWVMAQKVWDYLYEKGHQPMGDCDDKATFMMALLLNRRETVRAIGAWQKQYAPTKTINHVYTELKTPAGWIPLETSSMSLSYGKQSPSVVRVKEYYASVDGQIIQ